jgi:hypothetical protein
MAVTAAVSVAAFSVVLAESFAAVAMSSLVPATFVQLARLAKAVAAGAPGAVDTAGTNLVSKLPGGADLAAALKEAAKSTTDIDILVPKTARITADFEFEGTESYTVGASAGGAINVVSVAAGFSALYASKSTSKIHLEVDFVSVNYAV